MCEPELGENCKTCPADCGNCPPEYEGLGFRLPYSPVSVGDTFWLTIYADISNTALGGWKFTIGYNPNVIELIDVSVDSTIWLFDKGTICSSCGELQDVQAWTTQTELTEKMNLFRLKCKALSSGTSELSFKEYSVSDTSASNIHPALNDNSITITN